VASCRVPASGAADVLPIVEADLKSSAMRVIDKAKELCAQAHLPDAVVYEVVEGDGRNVLCEAVERHHAEMLALGSHGYGAIKRSPDAPPPCFLSCCFSVFPCFQLFALLCIVDLPEV
jgi:nucleotide-binding universal stress UspA family protein